MNQRTDHIQTFLNSLCRIPLIEVRRKNVFVHVTLRNVHMTEINSVMLTDIKRNTRLKWMRSQM